MREITQHIAVSLYFSTSIYQRLRVSSAHLRICVHQRDRMVECLLSFGIYAALSLHFFCARKASASASGNDGGTMTSQPQCKHHGGI
jgi:hypothetical protein